MWGEFGDMEERREVFSIKYLEKRFSLYIGVNTRIIVRISGEWKCMLGVILFNDFVNFSKRR